MNPVTAATPGAPTLRRSSSRWLTFPAIALELGLLYLVAYAFRIENPAFLRLLAISAGGGLVSAVLPPRLRLPLFVICFAGSAVLLLGPVLGASLLALGLFLIGSAHVPAPMRVRVALMVALAALLMLLRTDRIPAPWSPAIWPILGSLFMFRMIVYLYDLNSRSAPVSFWHALGYFFMVPNLSFPLFPVVDYKTFCRSQSTGYDLKVLQTGVELIFRGMVQLAIYRLIYHHLAIDIAAVETSTDAMRFVLVGYAMYLKISGSFHVIAGVMHLFGFDLPLTNRNYFLAAGFTDYWRRINIYWKDFLQKVFFNPLYFRFSRRMSAPVALTVSTVLAFFATWALHSWQWFWIRGSFPVREQDIVFWTAMGLLVLGNMLYENSFGRRRTLGKTRQKFSGEVRRGLFAAGTFVTISILWTIWSTESLGDFWLVVTRLFMFDVESLAWLGIGVLAIVILSIVFMRKENREAVRARETAKEGLDPRAPFRMIVVLVLVLSVRYAEHPLMRRILPVDLDPPGLVQQALATMRNPNLTSWDAEKLDRGYYEDLTNVVNFNSQLSDLYAQRPPNWDLNPAEVETPVFPPRELRPSQQVEFKGARFRTNRWGMRDHDYQKSKPTGTWRLALLGESNTMGQGVNDDETFESVVEDRLNANPPVEARRYELLNFALADCGPVAKLVTLERSLEFAPDAVLYVAVSELFWMTKELVLAAHDGRPLPDPRLTEALAELGVNSTTPRAEAVQRVESRDEELLAHIYHEVVARCRSANAMPMIAFLPLPRDHSAEREAALATERRLAAEAGFVNVEMYDAFDGVPAKSLWVRPWDSHINATGQALLADRIEENLRSMLKQGF